jgi:TPR repeat protein
LTFGNRQGVRQDYAQALMWVNLAASHVDAENRGVIMQSRNALNAKMTPAQIAEAQRMACEWMQNHPSKR